MKGTAESALTVSAMATAVVAVADLGEEDLVGRGKGEVGEGKWETGSGRGGGDRGIAEAYPPRRRGAGPVATAPCSGVQPRNMKGAWCGELGRLAMVGRGPWEGHELRPFFLFF